MLTWHGVGLGKPDFSQQSHSLAWELRSPDTDEQLWAACNAWREPLCFQLPPALPGCEWRRVVDTERPSPGDFVVPAEAEVVTRPYCWVQPRSVVLLVAVRV
jgi:glycogen operon protein